MRSPISDANAGAATDVAPTKQHAVRAATVAKQGNNQALQDAKQVNQIASTLGNALGTFMQGKRETELEQRYQQAYHAQGVKTGLDEYQKDLKKTGFTEFIYGGQTPEYKGALDASARNASNAMMLEEQEFVESPEGMAMSPEQYQKRLQDKLTTYNEDNFSDAPDAAFAFMKNWQDNSNELSRQQVKNNQVYQQQEARRTVAEGFHTQVDVIKSTVKSNPDRAVELGQKLFSMDNKPTGMSDTAYRSVLVEESLVGVEAGDYMSLKLLNESGLVSSFDSKTLKRYKAGVKYIDTNNFDALEAGRLSLEAVIEDPYSTSTQVAAAQQQYDAVIMAAAARDTGSAKHIKSIAGADRWRGTLANQYQKRLSDVSDEEKAAATLRVTNNRDQFEADLYYAEPDARRGIVADRIDDLYLAMKDPSLNDGQRKSMRAEAVKWKKQLEKWDSEKKTKDDKAAADALKKETEEANAERAGEAMLTRGSYVSETAKEKKGAVAYAVNSTINTVLPDDGTGLTKTERLEQIVTNPMLMQKWLTAIKPFENEAGKSPEVENAVVNLVAGLKLPNENNTFTEGQKAQAKALRTLQIKNPVVYNQVLNTPEKRAEADTLMQAAELGTGVEEARRELQTDKRNVDKVTAINIPAKDVIDKLQLSNSPPYVQDIAYQEYKANIHRGTDAAMNAARNFMNGVHTTADSTFVEYGSTFEPVNGKSLDDVMKIMKQVYRDESGQTLSGWTVALQRLYKNDSTKAGQDLYTLKQSPTLRVSIWDGQLMLIDGDRRALVSSESIGVAVDAYSRRQVEIRRDEVQRNRVW